MTSKRLRWRVVGATDMVSRQNGGRRCGADSHDSDGGSWIEVRLVGHGDGRDALGGQNRQWLSAKDARLQHPLDAHPGIVFQRGGGGPAHDHGDDVGIGHATTDDEAIDHELILGQPLIVVDKTDDVHRLAGKGLRRVGRRREGVQPVEQIAVARAYWGGGDCTSSSGPGTCLAGAIEVYPTVEWGTLYLAPGGVNENYSSQFEYAAFVIQAAEDDTNITVTGASIGSTQCSAGSLTNLDQGQSCIVPGVNLGASVTAADGKPVQVHLLTGDINSSYEYDAFTLVPRTKWGPSYYSPVGTTASFLSLIHI